MQNLMLKEIVSIFRHPVLNKDLLLNDFIQDLDVSHELAKTSPIYKGSQNIIAWRLKMLGSKKEKAKCAERIF